MQRNTVTCTNNSTSHQACAACKHQRKKCTDKCILAPFFPADKAREFQAVHKVFGVSNVQKIVRGLAGEDDRKRAADSLIWEAFCRQRDPILGPYGEYRRVHDELRLYKTARQHQPAPAHQGGLVYKPTAGGSGGLMGWKMTANGPGQGPINVSSGSFGFGSGFENAKGREKANHIHHHLPQPPLINGFNQQYYHLSGQLSPLDIKSIESSIWEDTGS